MAKFNKRPFNKQKPVAVGRRSKIFAYDQNSVIKVYEKRFSQDSIHKEFEKGKIIASSTKLPIPKPLKIVERTGLVGIIFERVEGVSALDLMQKKLWLFPSLMKKLAEIHLDIHTYSVKIETQEEFFLSIINDSDRLSQPEKKLVKSALKRLNISNPKLCHGDFHQGNLLLHDNKYFILDWMDSFSGNPVLDVALTAVNSVVASVPRHIPQILNWLYRELASLLPLDRYYVNLYRLDFCSEEVQNALLVASAYYLTRCTDKDYSRQKNYFEKQKNENSTNC